MTRISMLLVLAAVLAVGAGSAVEPAAAEATTPLVLVDPAGDSKSALDVTRVTLTPGPGTVAFDLTFTGTFASADSVLILLDTDRNGQTGRDGFEYGVFASDTGLSLGKWDGTSWAAFDHQPLQATLTATDLAFTITLADLGGVTAFEFAAGALRGDDVDVVPDHGLAVYGAEPEAAPATPTVKSILLPGVVLFPKAGKVLRVPRLELTLSDGSIVRATSQSCELAFKGKKLPALAGGCAWKIPKAYKKKRLVLRLTLSYGDETKTVSWPLIPS